MAGTGFGFSNTSLFSSSSTSSSPFSFGFSNPSSNPTSTTSAISFGVGFGTASSTTGAAATPFGGSSAPTNASSSASSAPRFSFPSACGSPGFSVPAASATGLGTAATTPATSFSRVSTSASSDFSFLKSTTSVASGATSSSTLPSFGTTGFQSSTLKSLLSSVPTSKAAAAGTTPSATTASILSAATASSTASSGLTFPVSIGTAHAVSTALNIVTSVPSSGFTSFSAASAPSLTSGASSAFSLSLKSPLTVFSVSSQSQSVSALPSLGSPSLASTTPMSSTAGSSAQTTSSLVVSSSSGTTSTTSTALASAPKLPSEITGRTVEEDLSIRRAMVSIIEDDADFDFSFLSSRPSQPVSSSFTPSGLELATAKASLRHFLNMNLSTLGTMEKATVLSAASILKSFPEFSESSAFGILDTLDSMFISFQDSSSTLSEILIQVGNFKAQKKKLDGMLSERKNILSILHQKNKDFDAKEELVKRLETELTQHKVDMMTFLHDSEVLKASSDELKFGIQSLGDELVNQKEAYQNWEDTMKKAEAARADCHSKWEDLRKLDLS